MKTVDDLLADVISNFKNVSPQKGGAATPNANRPQSNAHAPRLEATLNDHRPPEFSDESLALRFTEANQNALRYVAGIGKWLVWDGRRWCFDETLIARDRARAICRQASAECTNPRTAKLIASAKTVTAIERLAQADRCHAVAVDVWDTDVWLLNTPAGTVDLRSGKMHRHRPEDHLTKITAVAPDRSCPTPTWQKFLDRITGGDNNLIAYLRRMSGYSLTGSTKEQAMFFAHGGGANGKTTFVNTIAGIIGDYHKTTPIESLTESNRDRHPTELARLWGARLVTATETERGRRWAESRIKQLTGGDKIPARFMKKDFFEYVPEFKLLVLGNHKPMLRSVDEAIRRRFNLVPFTITIPEKERDGALPEKLRAEWPGILAWMVDGCNEWREAGLAPPTVVTDATADYLHGEDSIAAWFEECCVLDERSTAGSSVLFQSWREWAERHGETIGSQKVFSQSLSAHGFAKDQNRKGKFFIGLRLATPADRAERFDP